VSKHVDRALSSTEFTGELLTTDGEKTGACTAAKNGLALLDCDVDAILLLN
jgi:hypothetical protein